jgi:MFS family permease
MPSIWRRFRIDFKVHRDYSWFLFAIALLGVPGTALQTYALYYLMDVFKIPNPASVTGNLLVVVGISLLVTAYPAGRLSDRVGRKPILVASGILGIAGILILFFSRNYMQIMFSGALLGIANGALLSAGWALATDFAVKGEEAKYLGFTELVMSAGTAVARLLGPVIDFFNRISQNLGYQVMLLVCLISLIAGIILIINIRHIKPSV